MMEVHRGSGAFRSSFVLLLFLWTLLTHSGHAFEELESNVPDLIVYNEEYSQLANLNASKSELDPNFSNPMNWQNDFPFMDLNQPSLYKSDDLIGCIEQVNENRSFDGNFSLESDVSSNYLLINSSLSTINLVTDSVARKPKGFKRNKLWRNLRNNYVQNSSKNSVVRVNMKSKKLYMNKNKTISPTDSYENLSKKNNVSDSNTAEDIFMDREKTFLTRHFLKVAPQRESLFTTLAPLTSTMRVRSRMSRDNRKTIQAIERERNHQAQELNRVSVDYTESHQPFNRKPANLPGTNKNYGANDQNSLGHKVYQPHSSQASDQINEIKPSHYGDIEIANENHLVKPTSQAIYPSLPVIQPLQQHVKPKLKSESQLHFPGGRVQLSGSSSSPVEPIKPLLQLGGRGGSVLPQHPVFDDAAPKNLTGLTGSAAYLHCVVHNLANRSVSWIRQRDLHILTVDRYTYTTDQRFQMCIRDSHDDQVVNYDSPRGGVTVVTERGNVTRGYLLIQEAKGSDSGNYSCAPSNTAPTSLRVHVLNGEMPAAMQTSSAHPRADHRPLLFLLCLLLLRHLLTVTHGSQLPAMIVAKPSTKNTTDSTGISDSVNETITVDNAGIVDTTDVVDTTNKVDISGAAETAGIVNTTDVVDTTNKVDISDAVETADAVDTKTAATTNTVDISDATETAGNVDTTDAIDTINTVDTTEAVETADAVDTKTTATIIAAVATNIIVLSGCACQTKRAALQTTHASYKKLLDQNTNKNIEEFIFWESRDHFDESIHQEHLSNVQCNHQFQGFQSQLDEFNIGVSFTRNFNIDANQYLNSNSMTLTSAECFPAENFYTANDKPAVYC
ncbi:uncharacterized protein LOC108669471 [Hyalella azteca]|uniref:Uncharacterized protein LOC108669471 n=1 Tax=Hyalella azteca TaxID=294128 RepID=A0A8B7NFA5_HYAAZ|nr:uncharacterized protein LOC108669471 [Hyalella azteca]